MITSSARSFLASFTAVKKAAREAGEKSVGCRIRGIGHASGD